MTEPKPAHGLTPSQTVGPYFHYMLTPKAYGGREIITADLTTQGLQGEKLRIEGRVFDADGAPVPDAMIEIWQADSNGAFAHAASPKPASNGFRGFGRCPTDAHGAFAFDTIMPGGVETFDGIVQSPHVAVHVFARGMPKHLATRIYFAGRADLASDPALMRVPEGRRDTLLAREMAKGLREFNIRLGGEAETVFFDI